MLGVLDREDDTERDDCENGGPEPEVSSPDACEVLNLEGGLYCGGDDECSNGYLIARSQYGSPSSSFFAGGTTHQLRIEMPILLDRLCRTMPIEIPQCPSAP